MSDTILEKGPKLCHHLLRVAMELETSPRGNKELNQMDAKAIMDAAEAVRILATEVNRLRLGIGCWHYGRLGHVELYQMSQNWNFDPVKPGNAKPREANS